MFDINFCIAYKVLHAIKQIHGGRPKMYAQLVETGVKRIKDLSEMSEEERAFQEKIDSEIKIEAKNWMPDAYRQTLIRQISQHAHSDIVGMLP